MVKKLHCFRGINMNIRHYCLLIIVAVISMINHIEAGDKGGHHGLLALAAAMMGKKHSSILPLPLPIPIPYGHHGHKTQYFPIPVKHHTNTIHGFHHVPHFHHIHISHIHHDHGHHDHGHHELHGGHGHGHEHGHGWH